MEIRPDGIDDKLYCAIEMCVCVCACMYVSDGDDEDGIIEILFATFFSASFSVIGRFDNETSIVTS